jgi:hypothetical protein
MMRGVGQLKIGFLKNPILLLTLAEAGIEKTAKARMAREKTAG